MPTNCVFCDIVNGKLPSQVIWENSDFIAILDINPNTEGATLVLPKKHFGSYPFEMPEKDYLKFMADGREVGLRLDKALKTERTAVVIEGMGINHAHIKLYPLHGLKEKFTEMWAKEKVFFEKYEGYLTTQLGPQKRPAELKKIADKIRG